MQSCLKFKHFYINYYDGYMGYDHSHARHVLRSVSVYFNENTEIKKKLDYIDSHYNDYTKNKIIMSTEIKEVSKLISYSISPICKFFMVGTRKVL